MNTEQDYEFHEIANLFPLMEGKQLDELVKSMRENGYLAQYPVVTFQSKILDGRNRQRACKLADVSATYDNLPEGVDPFAFVAAANLSRRHLSAAQRAFIASAMAKMKEGRPKTTSNEVVSNPNMSRKKAAKMMEVPLMSLERARAIEQYGSPELINAAKKAEIPLTPAAIIARSLPKAEQSAALATAKTKPKRKPKVKQAGRAKNHTGNGKHPPTSDEHLRKPIETKLRKLGKVQLSVVDHNFDPDWEKQFNTNYATAWPAWYKAMQKRLAWEPPWDHISERDLAMLVTRLFDTWQGWRKAFPDIPIAELIRMTAVRLHQKFSI